MLSRDLYELQKQIAVALNALAVKLRRATRDPGTCSWMETSSAVRRQWRDVARAIIESSDDRIYGAPARLRIVAARWRKAWRA